MAHKGLKIFVVICVLLLVAIFYVWAVGQIDSLAPEDNSNINITEEDNTKGPDLLITPASKIYMSIIDESDPVRGSGSAQLTILEFGDFECPYCQSVSEDLSRVLVEYQGRVNLVWKDFPSPSHANARTAALAARCAEDEGKFWQYHDYLFVNQEELSRELYNDIALELKLDLARFNKCLDNSEKIELVGQGLTDGQAIGVDATPYFFIGNKKYDYALTYGELRKIIDSELN